MSYHIALRVENGQVTLGTVSGSVPDGTFAVWGHDDHGQAGLSVEHREPDGRFAGSASHEHPSRA